MLVEIVGEILFLFHLSGSLLVTASGENVLPNLTIQTEITAGVESTRVLSSEGVDDLGCCEVGITGLDSLRLDRVFVLRGTGGGRGGRILGEERVRERLTTAGNSEVVLADVEVLVGWW